ncbi:MAG: type II/IV secretion system ATPase subunit [Candidatus Pacearchaeota archaeon]
MFGKSKNKGESILNFERPNIEFSPQVPPLKNTDNKTTINVRYCLISPYAYAHIYWDPEKNELVYNLEEPPLNNTEKDYKDQLIEAMESMINFDVVVEKDQDQLLEYIDQRFKVLAFELGMELDYESYKKIYYYLARDFVGMNESEALLKDFFIEDIECNGIEAPIYIAHRYYGNIRTNVQFENLARAQSFVEKLAQRAGKYISYSQPILDGSLPDGSRVNATYTKDVTSKGPTFTIRKFTEIPWTPPQLLSFKTLSLEMMAYLWILVEHKMNILVAGGTGSGKTTLLNVLAFFIPPEERVVSIEDTRELNLPRDNWLPAVERSATGAGDLGEVTLFNLLKSSFRQRPDYIIVGEVRGKEAFVLFQGMASGHPSISTIHAESVETVIKRLETPPIELSPTLVNVLDTVCIMTHAIVNNQDTRKLKEVVEVSNVDDKGVAYTNKPFVWNPQQDSFFFKRNSKVFQKIQNRFGKSQQELQQEFQRRTKLLYTLTKQKEFGFKKFQQIVNEYYKNPQKILQQYNIQ